MFLWEGDKGSLGEMIPQQSENWPGKRFKRRLLEALKKGSNPRKQAHAVPTGTVNACGRVQAQGGEKPQAA